MRKIAIMSSILVVLFSSCGTKEKEAPVDYSKYLDFVNQGDSLLVKNKIEEASKSYKEALKYNKSDKVVEKKIQLIDSTKTLIKQNKFEEAKNIITIIIQIPASEKLSPEALAEAGIKEYKPLQVRFQQDAKYLIVIVSGGAEFESQKAPYQLEGISCTDCTVWEKKDTAFVGTTPLEKVTANKVRVKDRVGSFYDGAVQRSMDQPVAETDAKLTENKSRTRENDELGFDDLVRSGDSLYKTKQYNFAKEAYQGALTKKPGDKETTRKVQLCDEMIAEQQNAELKKIDKVSIPSGSFTMGSNDGNPEDGPTRTVSIQKFQISRTEVTVAQYRNFCNATNTAMPQTPPHGWQDNEPIVNITWEEAAKYCAWQGGRLPTEAEWEYAANANQNTTYAGSNTVDKVAVYKNNSKGKPKSVGSKAANAFGLVDMSGNVSEWCSDWYGRNYYSLGENTNPKGPKSGTQKVIRGSAFNNESNSTQDGNQLRITYRNALPPTSRSINVGFRVAW